MSPVVSEGGKENRASWLADINVAARWVASLALGYFLANDTLRCRYAMLSMCPWALRTIVREPCELLLHRFREIVIVYDTVERHFGREDLVEITRVNRTRLVYTWNRQLRCADDEEREWK